MDVKPEPHYSLKKSIVFSAVLIGGFFLLAELAVRGWGYYLRDDAERFDLATQTFVLVPGEHRSEGGLAKVNSQGFAGPEFKPQGADLWKIVAVGDSCTYGAGQPGVTYPLMMQELLEPRQRPGRRFEVVNAGISGLNSELALRRLRSKVIPLHPDVVTIYIGWNDLMKFDPAGQASSRGVSRVAYLLDKLWLVKGLRKLIFYYVRPRAFPPATGPESRTGRFQDFRPVVYEGNLRAMVDEVRRAGARPVLATLPTVLRPDMTVAELREAGVIFPYFPSVHGVGDFLDLIAAYNASIVRVGQAAQVPVVDLAASFEKLDDPSAYFFDTMHLLPKGMRLVADRVVTELERHELLGSSLSPGPASPLPE